MYMALVVDTICNGHFPAASSPGATPRSARRLSLPKPDLVEAPFPDNLMLQQPGPNSQFLHLPGNRLPPLCLQNNR